MPFHSLPLEHSYAKEKLDKADETLTTIYTTIFQLKHSSLSYIKEMQKLINDSHSQLEEYKKHKWSKCSIQINYNLIEIINLATYAMREIKDNGIPAHFNTLDECFQLIRYCSQIIKHSVLNKEVKQNEFAKNT